MFDRQRAFERVLAPDPVIAVLLACAISGFVFAASFPGIVGVDSRIFTVPYRAFVLTIAGIVLLRWLLQPRAVYAGNYVRLFAFVWVLMLARMAYDFNVQPMPLALPATDYLAIAVGTCLLPALAMLESPGPATLRLAWILAFGLSMGAFGGVCVMLLREGVIGLWSGRLSTDVINPVTLGHLGASLSLLSVSKPASVRPAGRMARALLLLVLTTCFIAGLLLTIASASRGPMLAVLVGLFALVVLRPGRSVGVGVLTRGLPLLLLVAGLGALLALAVQEYTDLRPVERVTSFMDESNTERSRLVVAAWLQFTESPWLGDAMFERVELNYPHNVLVEALMATGILGFLAMCGIFVMMGRAILGILLSRPDASWVAMIALQAMLASLVSGSLFQSDIFWVYATAVVVISSSRHETVGLLPIQSQVQAPRLLPG